jgi:sarcosine oxidase, subunit beta
MPVESAEVGVVGGGIHGVSAAYHLAARGVKTWLFERGAPASGPTGRSSAICRAYYTNEFLARVARESLQMFAGFGEITGGRDAGFRRTGALFLHPPEDLEKVFDAVARMNRLGTMVDLLDLESLGRDHPEFDLAGVAMGAWERDAGYADPVSTTDGLFRRAVDLGLRASLHSAVSELRAAHGGGANVGLADGTRVQCDRLLIAAGPWTGTLAAQLGVELPLTVERHIVATFGWGTGPRLPFVLADISHQFYLKPEGAELFLVGPLHEEPPADPDHFEENIHQAEIQSMARGLTSRVPTMRGADSRGGWASLYDVSPDWQPVIGAIGDRIFVDAGTSGHGFKLAPGLGRHVADLVMQDSPDPGLEQFHPKRFDSGAPLAAGYGSARILG